MKRQLDQRGFLEVEVMLMGAIGIFMLTAVIGGITSMITFQKQADVASEAQLFVRELAYSLRSEDQCTGALGGTAFPTMPTYDLTSATAAITASPTGFAANALPETDLNMTVPISGASVNVFSGFMVSPSLRVKKISLIGNSQYGDIPFTLRNGTNVIEKLAIIRVQTERIVDGQPARSSPPKDIPVKVLVDQTTGQVQNCNVAASAALTCEQMGGVWNPTAPADQRCLPRGSCQFGGNYSPAPTNQGGFPNALTGGLSCTDSSFVPQRTGTVTYAQSCGKTCIRNTYYPIYTCTRCAFSLAAPGSGGVINVDDANLGGAQALDGTIPGFFGFLMGIF